MNVRFTFYTETDVEGFTANPKNNLQKMQNLHIAVKRLRQVQHTSTAVTAATATAKENNNNKKKKRQ
jgi:hypothetical protein